MCGSTRRDGLLAVWDVVVGFWGQLSALPDRCVYRRVYRPPLTALHDYTYIYFASLFSQLIYSFIYPLVADRHLLKPHSYLRRALRVEEKAFQSLPQLGAKCSWLPTALSAYNYAIPSFEKISITFT